MSVAVAGRAGGAARRLQTGARQTVFYPVSGRRAGPGSRAGRATRHRGSSWVTGLDLQLLPLHRTSLIRDTGDVATCRSASYQWACTDVCRAVDMHMRWNSCRIQAVARLDICTQLAHPAWPQWPH